MTTPPRPPPPVSIADYEALAQARLPAETWAYFSGGAADELTLKANRTAFDRFGLPGRVLADFSQAHTRLTLLGETRAHPLLLAPVAYQRLAHPDGEFATAAAAAATGTPWVISSQASVTLEALAEKVPQSVRWFQVYFQTTRDATADLIKRAEATGCRALVVTVDAALNGVRHREWRAGFRLPPEIDAANLRPYPPRPPVQAPPGGSPVFDTEFGKTAPTWADLAWLRAETRLPLLVKGILTPEDALRALALGVDGIVVSNHGGRTLDTLPATLDALPAIVTAVAGRVPVLFDGGIRRGTDLFKALAMGATAVLTGRSYLYGLAAAGAPGVGHVIQLLRAEFEAAMVFTGCPTLEEVRRCPLLKRSVG